MSSCAIEISNLVFRYEADAFELSIPKTSIRNNEQVAVVGPSGCGKTTLAYLISGIYLPYQGTVSVGERVVSDMTDVERRDFRISNIGFIFQEFELLDYLRVEENILLPYLVNSSLSLNQSVRDHARWLAESTGIGDKWQRYPEELSQGEKQRLAICRALVTSPRIIIADEPTGNLDSANTETIMMLIRQQADNCGATFVMITHEQALLSRFDRVIDMENIGGGNAS